MSALVALCLSVAVIDGDTFRCTDASGTRVVRIAGIDTPELPGHCRRGRKCTAGDPVAAREALLSMVGAGPVRIKPRGIDHYGRTIAVVIVNGHNVGCALIQRRVAVARYGSCR